MENEPKLKLENVKVLSVNEGSYQWEGKTRKQWNLVLQDMADPTRVLTGTCNKENENFKQGAELGKCWVYEREFNGTKQASFFFPTDKGGDAKGFGGKGGGYGQKEDAEAKFVSMGFSYAKDIMLAINAGEWNWESYFQFSDQLAAAMKQTYKALKG